ncbi:MAG: efflux RND transporter periplasmic adaptor subunit, partial [Geobacteraceae bacterium]|nr:efflux RND transporter periplasmic adaptor subunit [Geobacteraceae bacterium]
MRISTAVKGILLVIGLAVALGGGYLLGSIPHDHEHPGRAAGGLVAKVLYTCSMHPFIIRDAPGNCPICGMTLTPVKSDKNAGASGTVGQSSGTESGVISIDPVTIQNMGVRTEKVVKRKLHRTIRAVGLITYEENLQFSVNAKIEGWVERLYFNKQGQQVKKGQPLMEIYSPELVAAQQEYLLAVDNKRQLAASPYPEIASGATRLLEAAHTRLRYWDISPEQIQTIAQSGQVRKTLTLYSEHDGVVTKKNVLEGMRIMAGVELLQIADLSKVWVNADIYEYEMPWVKVGQAVQVELPFANGKIIDGVITYIYPYMANETRTVKARIEVANPGLKLKPEMYANVIISVEAVDAGLAIPVTAVLNSGKGQTVFVALGEGKFEPRLVKSGIKDDSGFVQILSGLKEDEVVVVSAQFMLDS